MPDPQTISSTSQKFLDIYDILDNILILKNGSTAVILTVNAMNFGLLAEQEQDAVIYSYAGLLNSINYPIQILIQSQTKDASSYLQLLKKREEKTTDELKKSWIRRYSSFVSNLIKERNVLDKKFYVVIPASSLEMGLTPTQNLVSGFKEQTIDGVEKSLILEKARNLLDPKRDHLLAQFNRIGLYARQLKTQEIIRLFYTNYNPEASEGQQITNSQSYTTALVQAQIRGDLMNKMNQQNQVMPEQAAQVQTNQPQTTQQPTTNQPVMKTPPASEQATTPQPMPEQATPTPTPPVAAQETQTMPMANQTGDQAPQATPQATPQTEVPDLSENPTLQKPASSSIPQTPQQPTPPSATTSPSQQSTPAPQADIDQALNEINQPGVSQDTPNTQGLQNSSTPQVTSASPVSPTPPTTPASPVTPTPMTATANPIKTSPVETNSAEINSSSTTQIPKITLEKKDKSGLPQPTKTNSPT